jgi:Methyltransferase domain
MRRLVIPELLDELPPDDPRAVHSRGDLRRVNKLMGNADIIAGALGATGATGAVSIVELGGGDGTFLLELAKRAAATVGPARAMLVDQQDLLTDATREALAAFSWHVTAVKADVFHWLSHRGAEVADVTIANLFLHHFEGQRLATLLRDAASQTRMFAACEPHRSGAALAAASLMGVIGCNSVTVHDARISVRAGFRDRELSAIWPAGNGWTLEEKKAGRFTHGFVARHGAPRG